MEIHQNPEWERRLYIVQKAAWGLVVLLLIGALAGLTGGGGLSRAATESPEGGIRVEYDRFVRLRAPETMRIRIAAPRMPVVRLWLDRDYAERMQMDGMLPQPESFEAADNRILLAFRVADPDHPAAISFSFHPQIVGRITGGAGLEAGPHVQFRQWVYP